MLFARLKEKISVAKKEKAKSVTEATPFGRNISVEKANLWYGDFHALKNIDIEIPENKITAFIGPSGCGGVQNRRRFSFGRRGYLRQNGRQRAQAQRRHGISETQSFSHERLRQHRLRSPYFRRT